MNAAEITGANSAANLIVATLALFLAGFGAIAWLVAAHPQRVRNFIYGVRDHPLVVRAEQRYRGQIEFLVRRLKPEGAFGLSFTVGLAALAVSVWIFGGVLHDVLAHEEIALIDAPIVSYIAIHRLPWLTKCMESITYLGSAALLTAVVIAGSLCMRFRTGSWRPLLLLASAAVGAVALDTVLKFAIARPRPATEWMVASAVGWAFPSGHTTESTSVYGALAYLIAETQATWRSKVQLLAFALMVVFLIGISRIYLGVHWPTDVMSGWALGVAWLAVVFTSSSTVETVRADAPP
jgi:membrane-associated phospholipid phosphatase